MCLSHCVAQGSGLPFRITTQPLSCRRACVCVRVRLWGAQQLATKLQSSLAATVSPTNIHWLSVTGRCVRADEPTSCAGFELSGAIRFWASSRGFVVWQKYAIMRTERRTSVCSNVQQRTRVSFWKRGHQTQPSALHTRPASLYIHTIRSSRLPSFCNLPLQGVTVVQLTPRQCVA